MRPPAFLPLAWLLVLPLAQAQNIVPSVPANVTAPASAAISHATSQVGSSAAAATSGATAAAATAAASPAGATSTDLPAATAPSPAAAPSWRGQWKLNLAASQLIAARPKSATVIYTSDTPADFRWTATIVDASGQKHLLSFAGTTDGMGYPVKGDPGVADLSYDPVAGGLHAEQRNKNGTIIEEQDTLSADGKIMTRKMTATTSSGDKTTWTEVYDRVL